MHKKKIPDENVIKTLINGVKSSENQSERGLHETERISSDEYAEVNDIVQKDIYIYIYIYIYMYISLLLMTVWQVKKIPILHLREQINLNWC